MPDKTELMEFHAVLNKVQTIRKGDGAYRITLDVPLCDKEQMKKLMGYDTECTVFAVAMVEDKGGNNGARDNENI